MPYILMNLFIILFPLLMFIHLFELFIGLTLCSSRMVLWTRTEICLKMRLQSSKYNCFFFKLNFVKLFYVQYVAVSCLSRKLDCFLCSKHKQKMDNNEVVDENMNAVTVAGETSPPTCPKSTDKRLV